MSPLLQTFGNATAQAYGWGKSSAKWIGFWVTYANATYINSPKINTIIDSAGNIITAAYGNVFSLSPAMTFNWQYSIASPYSLNGSGAFGISLTGSNSVVLPVSSSSAGLPNYWIVSSAGSSSGWGWAGSATTNSSAYSAGDSSGNLYIGVNATNPTSSTGKANSSGAFQWARSFNWSSNYPNSGQINSIVVDSSSNVYIAYTCSYTTYVPMLIKYNSAGTIQWQRYHSGGGSNTIYRTQVDSSGNIYTLMQPVNPNWLISQVTSAGALGWSRSLTPASGTIGLSQMICDSSGNSYSVIPSSTVSTVYIVKYNSSGVIQWQRKLTGFTTSNNVGTPMLDANGNLIVVVSSGSTVTQYGFKLPVDGSATGTIVLNGVTFTYATSTDLTDASYASTWAASTGTDAASANLTGTNGAYTQTYSTSSLTVGKA